MRISEILTEAKKNPKIEHALIQKGYKFLSNGSDQDVYLAPDGTILKIFGYGKSASTQGLSRGQKSFIDFANYCMNNPTNTFLPQFGGWDQFEFEGQKYLQIKCERLFDFKENEANSICKRLEQLVISVKKYGSKLGFEQFMRFYYDFGIDDWEPEVGSLIMLLGGEKEVELFCETIDQLYKLANRKHYKLDLHRYNFMLDNEGNIVINDPFYVPEF